MAIEKWLDIEGYKNYYQISNYGNVRSLNRTINAIDGKKYKISGSKMKPFNHRCGYLQIDLKKHSQKKTFYVHRLVAIHFVDNSLDKPQVNHIDGDKTNNHFRNLEFCTNKENSLHADKIGLRNIKGENCHSSKLKEHEVIYIKSCNLSNSKNIKQLSKLFNVSICAIYDIRAKRTWKHLDFEVI